MTPGELQEARDWTARKMGYHDNKLSTEVWIDPDSHTVIAKSKWTPDKDANQCFMLMERMGKLGWYLFIDISSTSSAKFYRKTDNFKKAMQQAIFDNNLLHAIIKAAMATDPASLSPLGKP